jgi:hypothetical protein
MVEYRLQLDRERESRLAGASKRIKSAAISDSSDDDSSDSDSSSAKKKKSKKEKKKKHKKDKKRKVFQYDMKCIILWLYDLSSLTFTER